MELGIVAENSDYLILWSGRHICAVIASKKISVNRPNPVINFDYLEAQRMTSLKRAQDDIEAQQKLLDDDSLVSQELSQLHPINSPLSLTPPPSMQYFSYSQDNMDNQSPIYPNPSGTLPYFLFFFNSIFQICF